MRVEELGAAAALEAVADARINAGESMPSIPVAAMVAAAAEVSGFSSANMSNDELSASAAQAYREHRPTALLKFGQLWSQTDIASRQNTETAAGRKAVGRRDELCEELEYAFLAMLDAGVPLVFLQVLADDDSADLSDDQKKRFLEHVQNAKLEYHTRGRVAAPVRESEVFKTLAPTSSALVLEILSTDDEASSPPPPRPASAAPSRGLAIVKHEPLDEQPAPVHANEDPLGHGNPMGYEA